MTVAAAFITPAESLRQLARGILGSERIDFVFVHCPVATCRARDPKGHYAEAARGARPLFTGIGAVFEEPAPGSCFRVDTSSAGVVECVDLIAARS